MERKRRVLDTIEYMLKTPLGDNMKDRMFRDMAGNAEIRALLKKESEPFNKLMAYYKCALMEMETKFRVLNEEFSLVHDRNPIEAIKTRLKSVESIAEKMNRRNIAFSTEAIEENLFDIAGIRIVCSFPEDIYFLADCILKQDDVKLIQKKDYIENPKPNGYRSLHLIVETPIFLENTKKYMKVEVQFRTIAMDFWASLEHKLKYKKDLGKDVDLDSLSAELKSCADASAELDLRMDNLRKKLGY